MVYSIVRYLQQFPNCFIILLVSIFQSHSVAASENWTFRILADSNSSYTGFYRHPAINCSAEVAFVSSTDSGSGLYVTKGSEHIAVHISDGPVDEYNQPALNDKGTVLFRHTPNSTKNGPNSEQQLKAINGASVTVIADGINRQSYGHTAINSADSVIYQGRYKSVSGSEVGLFMATSQNTILLVDRNAGQFKSFGSNGVAINNRGEVVFSGVLKDGTEGIFLHNANGLSKLVDTSAGVDNFLGTDINNSGDIVFFGYVKIDDQRSTPGLYLLRKGKLQPLGGSQYEMVYGAPNLNDAGGVVFLARSKTNNSHSGIFTGPNPEQDHVISVGDSVENRQIKSIHLGDNALNNSGQIVFIAQFEDGDQGIVLASPSNSATIATTDCTPQTTNLASLPPPPISDPPVSPVLSLIETIGPSAWITAERGRYTNLLAEVGYDVMVVPFQPRGQTLDAPGRNLLARRLVASLKRAGRFRVADPGLVEKALGEPARYVSDADIFALGKRLGVKMIMMGQVGQNKKSQLSFQLDIWQDKPGKVSKESTTVRINRENVPFSDTNLPYRVFAEHADQIISDITGKELSPPETKDYSLTSASILPGSFEEMLDQAARTPLEEAQQLVFLGTLYPKTIGSRSRDHLFERALLALESVSDHSPDRTIVEARALTALNRRPAAKSILRDSSSPETIALLAFLNANLPQLEDSISKIKNLQSRLMSEMDLQLLRYAYDRPLKDDGATAIFLDNPFWGPFLHERYVDGDPWGKGSNALNKLALDSFAPDVYFSLEKYVTGELVRDKTIGEVDLAKQVLNHVRNGYSDLAGPSLSSRTMQSSIHLVDILELSQANVLRNAIQQSRTEKEIKGRPMTAVDSLQNYQHVFLDHPQLTIEYALITSQLGNDVKLSQQQRKRYREESRALGRKAYFWSGEQNEFTDRINLSIRDWFPEFAALEPENLDAVSYMHDFPPRISLYYHSPKLKPKQRVNALKRCLDYTITNIGCAYLYQQELLKQQPTTLEAARHILISLDSRFIAHPDRLATIAAMQQQIGEEVSEFRLYQQAIESGDPEWKPYQFVGDKLVAENQYAEALESYLKYPGFNGQPVSNNIEISNRAYLAGSRLYWTGAWREAKPLYKIAASSKTGSEAELSSATRLALLERNWNSALQHTLRRLKRYKTTYAYRDYMSLLHFLGRSDESWALFDNLVTEISSTQIWTAAYAGHRINGVKNEEIIAWIKDRRRGYRSDPKGFENHWAMRYMFLTSVIDRIPGFDFGNQIQSFGQHLNTGSSLTKEHPTISPGIGSSFMQPDFPDRLAIAADAMSAFYHDDAQLSQQLFEKIGTLNDLKEFLPYYTLAALANGNIVKLQKYLQAGPERYAKLDRLSRSTVARFYDNLAAALVAGYSDDPNSALQHLNDALNNRPFIEDRTIFTYYQLVEMYEVLFEKTNLDEYRATGYRLAKRFQIIQPMYPWAYAFAANLAPSDEARIKNLAATLLLDPNSYRASTMGEETLRLAREMITQTQFSFDFFQNLQNDSI